MSKGISSTSVGRKVLMALSGFFLMFFLLQHLLINMLSIISVDAFNEVSEFMGTNPLIQFALQPVLFFGIIFHLIMGMRLELQNRKARPIQYAMNKPSENASWMSRNMIITGVMIMLFMALHMVDFFLPTINAHYITHEHLDSFGMVAAKFANPVYVGIYLVAFVFLALHLMHGFQSAFQSVGFNHKKYTPTLKKLGTLYAILVPLGYAIVAIFHFVNSL
ncbi:MAG: succinate dehydrogenase cytochrome b subunit [Flavobacteriales bacterium]|jgi:succinate dehydrogenase / fumarate reductase cytochrome b subunit|nr:succinate dehydrogenase cytochrome b subunit [Flavobacteriales bacterium]MCB9364378.1 succinate dehydrogenase cytochrome b subunit [Flavobacteriales bacterium]